MEWGITCFFQNQADFEVVAELAPNYPIRYIEIRGEQPFFAPEVLSDSDIDFFRKILTRAGVNVTLHSTFYDINLATINSFLKKATLDCYRNYLDLAQQIGAKVMVLHGGYLHKDAIGIPELVHIARQNLLDNLKILGDYGEQKGVVIGLENSPPNRNMLMVPDWEQQLEILRKLNHPNVKAVWDMAHAYLHGLDLYDYYRYIKEYLVEIHIHNNDGREDLHLGIQRGKIDYRSFFLKNKVAVPAIMEIRTFSDALESLEWIKQFENK